MSNDFRFSSYGPTLYSASLLRMPTRVSAALISREPIAVMRRRSSLGGYFSISTSWSTLYTPFWSWAGSRMRREPSVKQTASPTHTRLPF